MFGFSNLYSCFKPLLYSSLSIATPSLENCADCVIIPTQVVESYFFKMSINFCSLYNLSFSKKTKNLLLSTIIASSFIYLIVLVFLFFFQRSLLYHPNVNNYFNDKLKVDIEEVQIKTSDDINLLGWFHKKDLNRFKTVVYFHGNAGKLENRINKLNHFKDIDVNFLHLLCHDHSLV